MSTQDSTHPGKVRLTVTLSPDLVASLDRMIDRRTIRSRSHAVEVLLRRSLEPEVATAVLLAGGEEQGEKPAALAAIHGEPLIRLTVRRLAEFGVRRFVVLAGPYEEEVRSVLGAGEGEGVEVRYVREERPLGTAGALKRAERWLADGPFLVIHGDVLTDIDVAALVDFHRDEGTLATVAVKPRRAGPHLGKVMVQGSRITEFSDPGPVREVGIVNTGIYLFQPEVLGLIEPDRPSRLETDVFPRLARLGELSAFFFRGVWFDVRGPERHRRAEERWQRRGDPP